MALCPRLKRVEIHISIGPLDVYHAPPDHPPLRDDSDSDSEDDLEDERVPSNLLYAVVRSIPPSVRTIDVKVDLCVDDAWTIRQQDRVMSRVDWLEIGQWVAGRLEGVILRMDVPEGFRMYMAMHMRALENRSQLTIRTH